MDALGWSNAAVTALQWGTLMPLKDVPLETVSSPFPTCTPTVPQPLGWESQGNTLIPGETKSSPGRSRDPLGPAPACSGVPPPALQPQHPLGSLQPSHPRTRQGLRLFLWDAVELSRSPPNTTSPGLGGTFWCAKPLQRSIAPSRATRLAQGQSPWGPYHPKREACLTAEASEQSGRASRHPGG